MSIKQRLINFDTIDGIDNYDNTFSGRQNGSGQNVTGSHSYDTKMNMSSPINNIKNIALKSVELAFVAQNIRSANRSNVLPFLIRYNAIDNFITITLKDKNYTSISTLLGDINTAISVKIASVPAMAGCTVLFYVNPLDTSKIIIKANADTPVGQPYNTFGFYDGILTKTILGIATATALNNYTGDIAVRNVDNFSYVTATNCYNLQPDNYYNMSFTNIQTAPSNANGQATTFKIPLNGSFGEVIYYSENEGSEQVIYVDRPNTNLSYLNMVITDRWGFPVYGYGSQISFTLSVEYTDMY